MDSSYPSGGGLFPPESSSYGDWVNPTPSMFPSSSPNNNNNNNTTDLLSAGQQGDILAGPPTSTPDSAVMDFLMANHPGTDAAAGSGDDSILQQHLIAQQIALQQIQLQNSNKDRSTASPSFANNSMAPMAVTPPSSSKTTATATNTLVPEVVSTGKAPEPQLTATTAPEEDKTPENSPQVLLAEQRLQQGQCPSCGQQLYKPGGASGNGNNKTPKWKKFFQLGGNNNSTSAPNSGNTNTNNPNDTVENPRQKPLHIPGVVHRGQCVKCTKTNSGDDTVAEEFDNNPFLQDDGMDDDAYLQSSILNPSLRDAPEPSKEPDGQVLATYEGPLNAQGQRHGNGTLKWSNGDVYKGNFINGVRHGPGSLTFAKDKGEYVGDWENNLMHGQGTRRFPNGDLYVGPYVQGRREGTDGRFYYTNGDLFVGEWKEDRMHGFGRYYYHHGQRFEGDFFQGMRHGKGKLQRLDGSLDCFRYRNNLRQGTGARFSADRKSAWKLINGRQKKITIAEAVSIMYEIENSVENQTSTAHNQDIPSMVPQGLTV